MINRIELNTFDLIFPACWNEEQVREIFESRGSVFCLLSVESGQHVITVFMDSL